MSFKSRIFTKAPRILWTLDLTGFENLKLLALVSLQIEYIELINVHNKFFFDWFTKKIIIFWTFLENNSDAKVAKKNTVY